MTSTMHRDNDDDNGFRLSNLIDLVFPRWKDVAIIQPHDYSMGKAMRYYRVWIYVSCAVTVIPAMVFACVVAWIFTANYFQFLPLEAYDWTFLYLYAALFFQICIGPILGCLGASKLNKRLLWAYWGSMVALCAGDAIIGIVWAFKFTYLNGKLIPHLHSLLSVRYGVDRDFTSSWNYLQISEKCCGVENATEYSNSIWLKNLPTLKYQTLNTKSSSSRPYYTLPASCCVIPQIDYTLLASNLLNCSVPDLNSPSLYKKGCYLALHAWMHSMGDILFVLGYSVIAFVRAALVFCLYNEIKHFIRKIYIRGVPREMHSASVSAGSDLVNFHRNTSAAGKCKAASNIPAIRPRDRSLRRWSFIRGWRGFRDHIQNRATPSPESSPPFISSHSTVKLKSINEETTTML